MPSRLFSSSSVSRLLVAELWKPRPHQRSGVSWLLKHPEAGLLWDPGLGKTTVTMAAFQLLKKAKGVRKMLVIAPLRVCYLVWTHNEGGELWKWSNFEDITVSLLHGADKDEAVDVDADVYVINPAGLEWLIDNGHLDRLFKRGLDILAVDELSAFKHPRSKRFKRLKRCLGRFRRRWGLTGSPASNGLMDLFGETYILDLGRSLGRFITEYRARYFVPSGFGGFDWKLQQGAEKRIYRALGNVAHALNVQDAKLDLPPLVEQNLYVTLPKAVRKVYDALEEELFADIENDVVTAANAAVASGKLRQIASGGVYLEDREVKHLHNEKTDALVELVEELQGSPLLVPYEFHHDLARIREALGKDVPAINGEVAAKDSVAIANAWNRGELPILCGHPMAMGHGLNLQGSGSHICWYSMTWNYELYDQTVRRVWRQGQKKRVIVHRIVARSTIDEVLAQVLSSKKRTQDALFTALKALRTRS